MARILSVSQERAFLSTGPNRFGREVIDLLRRHTRPDKSSHRFEHIHCYRTGRPHGVQVPFGFENDHEFRADTGARPVQAASLETCLESALLQQPVIMT